jgi:hypothetical protein
MFNMEQMQKLIWAQFAKQIEQWPPELKAAMKNISVDVVLKEGKILITGNLTVEDENTIKARRVLFTKLVEPISQLIGAFQCKVTTYE